MSTTITDAISVSAYAAVVSREVRVIGGALVEGEVQKPRVTPRGMLCFDLTDGEAKFACKVFRGQRGGLDHEPKHGELVQVAVERPDFWPVAGKLDLIVTQIRLAGEGELLRRRAALLKRLQAEGLCDPERRKLLPRFPRAVGVIAGESSDGIADVIQALQDRFPPVEIVVCPSLVQGKAAPRALIDAIVNLQQHPLVDVIVIARGGGSVQDLLPFDDEGLCRAIFACSKPVVAAIGHTENMPVCNYVAHSAFTPSRSAELVVPSRTELRQELEPARQALAATVAHVAREYERVEVLADRLSVPSLIERQDGRVREQTHLLRQSEQGFFVKCEQRLAKAASAVELIPHNLPAADAIAALVSRLDVRAASFYSTSAQELDQARRHLDVVSAKLERANVLTTENGRQLAFGFRRQLEAHEHDYGRAIVRLLLETSSAIRRRLERELERLGVRWARARDRVDRGQKDAERDLHLVTTRIDARDFRRQGYPLAADEDGQPVRSVSALRRGERLYLTFGDGLAETIVDKTKEESG